MSGDTLKIIYKQFVIYVFADIITFVYEVPFIFLHYINVDGVSWITLKKILQSAMELLQIATGITKCDGFITNCDRYYKVRWLLQIATVQMYQKIHREQTRKKLRKA